MAKIAIVTVTLNSADFISESVQSLLSQNFSDFEHVVQDGGSNDNTVKIINSFADDRIHLISTPDLGLYDALNKGFQRTTAGIVGILHSDDLLYDEKVLCEVYNAFRDPSIDAVYGDLKYVDRTNAKQTKRVWIS